MSAQKSFALANVLSSSANAVLNTYISPRYSKLANRERAPGQPAPAAFGIWFPIFAGQIAYGFLPNDERSPAASIWNHAIAAGGAGYAWTIVNERFFSMQAAMEAMTVANFMYRRALPEPKSALGRAVKFSAEMGVGWLAAADLIVAAQNTRRVLGREFSHAEQDAVGAIEATVLAGAAIATNRTLGWSGVSVAAAWALGGIALDQRSEKHVRIIAGTAAVGVLADLGLKLLKSSRANQIIDSSNDVDLEAVGDIDFAHGEDAIGTDDEFVIVEETFIEPDIIIEEITTLRN